MVTLNFVYQKSDVLSLFFLIYLDDCVKKGTRRKSDVYICQNNHKIIQNINKKLK